MKATDEQVKQRKHDYMMLARYQMDLDYYLGCGNRCEKHLYFGNIVVHFREVVKLWKSLPTKPQWLRATRIIQYKKDLAL